LVESLGPLRILVAEDNETNRRLAMFMLHSLGFRPDFAVNGAEAVRTWENGSYDLILMDCQMPEMDGFQATREIRRREADTPGRARVWIVALTANALIGDRERCLAEGMDAYLSKPFTSAQLARVLARESRSAPGSSPAAQPGECDAAPLEQLWTELGGEDVRSLVEGFLQDLAGLVARLAAHAAANETAELGRLAHSLRGSALAFGLTAVGLLAGGVEAAVNAGDLPQASRQIASLQECLPRSQAWLRDQLDRRG